MRARIIFQHRIIDDGVFLEALRSGRALSAFQHFRQPAVDVAVKDRLFVVAVLGQTLDLLALDRHGALVLLHAVAIEDAHFHHRAIGARRHAQRGIAHVRRLLAEDGAQQLLLRRHRALALRRDLADQDVARLHLGADIDDAGLVEVLQGLLGDVGNVARDLLRTQLGVARHHLELLDVDRGEDVVADDPLRDQDRILEVVAVPRHEGDQHVAAQRQLAVIGRRPVGDHFAFFHNVADLDQRALGDAGVLVGALELQQLVDVDAGF